MAPQNKTPDTNKSLSGRSSPLSLPEQKELLEHIVAKGGIHTVVLLDVIKEKGYDKDPKIEKAVRNKLGDCKRSPEKYEAWQIRLFGRIIDNSKIVRTPTTTPTPTTPPPRCTVTSVTKSSTNKSSSDLAASFSKMSLMTEGYFGKAEYDHEFEVTLDPGYKNPQFEIWKTKDVVVGQSEKIVTDVITIKEKVTDPRWLALDFKKYNGFVPYAATQIDWDAVVIETPIASFDTLTGPPPRKEGGWSKKAFKKALIVSDEEQEQREFEIMRRPLLKASDPNTAWRYKSKLKFKGLRLDYSLIDGEARRGGIEFEVCVGPQPHLKWRIAVSPQADARILYSERKHSSKLKDKIADYALKRAEIEAAASEDADDDNSEYD